MVMKIHYCEKILYFVEMGSPHQVDNLCFTKNHLSLAEAEFRAELGNMYLG